MFFERCVVINARCVKLHYKIGTRNYKQNKAKAVEFARAFTASNPALFATDVAERFLQGGKQDDLADALILTGPLLPRHLFQPVAQVMPSTRSQGEAELLDLPSDDEYDPDYTEDES